MFLPTTKEELQNLGIRELDVILVTGDAYIDSSFIGVALIGKMLMNAGYTVGIIAQPDLSSDHDITRLGEPKLFWGVSAGSVDSMVANYTALKKPRRSDDFTPGSENTKRPDRATIAYTNLIRQHFKHTRPIVLGGIEASLRRISHYDYWDDKIRRSILVDAKADILVYGMGEKSTLALANALRNNEDIKNIRGICYMSKEPNSAYHILPSYDDVKSDKTKFIEAFHVFYHNNDPKTARGLCQKQDTRYLIQNPPMAHISETELDKIYELNFERDVHPYYKKMGPVRALETIRTSITSHRGCYGECNFCAITVHQGTTVISRSIDSIVREAKIISALKNFHGHISDVGGPTANMYGFECAKKTTSKKCAHKRCLYPKICNQMPISHAKQTALLKKLKTISGIKKIFIASGLRYDLILEDTIHGNNYLENLVRDHVSGQLKIAPEHTSDRVLACMGKSGNHLLEFKKKFDTLNHQLGKKQFLTYYFIAAHPGCHESDMIALSNAATRDLKMTPEQIQIFTPTPSTYSSLMYYTEINPFTNEKIFVEKNLKNKDNQKSIVIKG